jgi:tetratricopeptide (TPR) repeat protein
MSAIAAWYFRQMAVWSSFFRRDDSAIRYLVRLRASRPTDATVVARLAHLKAVAGARQDAIAHLHEALELDAGDAASWFNLGFVQQEEGAHDDALRSFDRAIDLDARLDRAWYGKALSLIKLGRIEEAVDPLERNTELQPMSPFGWYQLAHVHHRLGDFERTARVIRKLAGFEPAVARRLERETGVSVGLAC